MRAALLLALLALVPVAGATGEVVDILGVSPPERTMVDKPFVVEVTLLNRARDPVEVVLLGALYDADATECGPATAPGFRQFTHLVQERIRLAPAEERTVYGWAQQYGPAGAAARPEDAEWCAFVAEDAGERIEYLDVQSVPLSVRAANQRPEASVSWLPERPREAEDVWFTARGQDADGDPVTFRWDFGHANASGRTPVEGATPTHFFYPAGRYTVTLTASDGLEETVVAREVEVLAEGAPAEDRDAPLPLTLPLAGLALAALARARRPRCR